MALPTLSHAYVHGTARKEEKMERSCGLLPLKRAQRPVGSALAGPVETVACLPATWADAGRTRADRREGTSRRLIRSQPWARGPGA